jgi:hypothetical protein
METSRNESLWRKAKKRAAFKRHLQTYILVNAGFWILYSITTVQHSGHNVFSWPLWPMFGWGIGLVSHYFSAYGNFDERKSVEIEYEKLLREQR